MNADTTDTAPDTAPVTRGSTVKWNGGYYRVSARFSKTVNLRGVFGSRPVAKGVPVADVVEAYDEWSAKWAQSDAYRSM